MHMNIAWFLKDTNSEYECKKTVVEIVKRMKNEIRAFFLVLTIW